MKYLSEFFSEDGKRKSVVFLENEIFYVSYKSKSGTTYHSEFVTQQAAEDFAEDWVLGEKYE